MNDIYIILTKLLHIFLSGIFIMIIGILISKKLNDIYPENKRNKKKTYKLIIDFCVFTGLIYISHYFIRNLMEVINKNLFSYILFWSDSIKYDTFRLKELGGGIAMAFSMFLFMSKFKNDIKTLFNERLNIKL